MNTLRTFLIALSLVATINVPLLANGRRVCCVRTYPQVVVKEKPVYVAPQAAPSYSTSTTDNSVSYTYNLQYGQLPAAQGSTLYGYSQANTYANYDLGVDHLISQRLVADASAIQSKVLAGQQVAAASAAEIAKLQIKGQIITSALNALADTSTAAQTEATFKQEISVAGGASASVGAGISSDALLERTVGIVNAKCISCHGATRQAGDLDLRDLSHVDGAKILARVTNPDPTKRMPLGAGDTPGVPLGVGELSVLFQAVGLVE